MRTLVTSLAAAAIGLVTVDASALVTCVEGCNESVIAIRGAVAGGNRFCRIYALAQASLLKRVVLKEGDQTEVIVPKVNIQFWQCSDVDMCSAQCSNESYVGVLPGNQAVYNGTTPPDPPVGETCNGPIDHDKRRCKTGE